MNDLELLFTRMRALAKELEQTIAQSSGTVETGFSPSTTELGGWSHRILDEALASLRASDPIGRQVAEQAPKYLVFSPKIKSRLPKDPDAAALAFEGFQRHWAMQWLLGLEPFVLDFAVRKPESLTDALRNDYYEHYDSHGVILLPAGMDPETGVRKYAQSLLDKANWLRNDAESGRDAVSYYLNGPTR